MVKGDMTETPNSQPYPTSRPARRRVRRYLLAGVAVVIIVPIVAVAAALLTFNPNAYKDQMAAAATRALGRQVTIAGPVAVKLSLIPTLSAGDVRIANIPGGAAPLMARVRSIETRIALLPLLHHQIDIEALVLRHPTILLEKTMDGRANWLFQPQAKPAAAPPPAAGVSTGQGSWQVTVRSLDISDGTLDWRDEAAGRAVKVQLPHARITAEAVAGEAPEAAPLDIAANLLWQNQAITVAGKTGPLTHLTDPADQSSWPVQLTVGAAGATLTVQGGITDPRQGRGYDLTLQAEIPALEAMAPFLPAGLLPARMSLPPLHGVAVGAKIQDAGQGEPRFSNLSLQAQNSDLASLAPGLKLDSLSLVTPAPDQPISVNILGERRGLAFTLSGSVGPLPIPSRQTAVGQSPGAQPASPLPVDLMLTAAQSTFHAQGTIAQPWSLKGVNLALSAQVANLAYLSPLAGTSLPGFTTLNGTGTLIDETGGLAQGFTISGLDLTAPQGDLEGAVGFAFAPRPYFGANLRSARLDLNSVLNATAQPQAAVPATPPGPPAQPAQPAAKVSGSPRLIPDLALPLTVLKSFDARANLAFASLRLGGAEYRALVAHAELQDGVFSLDPSSVVVPGGQVLAAGRITATGATPHETFSMQAQNLAIAPLLKALQIPVAADGLVQVFANLTADGATTRQMAASVNGAFGLAGVDGVIDGHALASLIGPAIHSAGAVPAELLNAAGQVPMRCLAIRLDAQNGDAAVHALLLDTPRLLLQGTGTVDFGQERLALALQPDLYLGEMAVAVPLNLTGPFAAPRFGKVGRVTIDEEPGASNAQGLNGLVQSLVGGKHSGPPVSAACAPALNLARNGQPGPEPTGTSDASLLQKPMNLFQQLLRGH